MRQGLGVLVAAQPEVAQHHEIGPWYAPKYDRDPEPTRHHEEHLLPMASMTSPAAAVPRRQLQVHQASFLPHLPMLRRDARMTADTNTPQPGWTMHHTSQSMMPRSLVLVWCWGAVFGCSACP